MKITDVTLTLFAWDGIPATSYGAHTGKFSGDSKLGLLAIRTDQGLTGHAFLGSAFFPADSDGGTLIRVLKPLLMGQDPLDRERLYQAMWKRVRTTVSSAMIRSGVRTVRPSVSGPATSCSRPSPELPACTRLSRSLARRSRIRSNLLVTTSSGA